MFDQIYGHCGTDKLTQKINHHGAPWMNCIEDVAETQRGLGRPEGDLSEGFRALVVMGEPT